MLKKFYWPFLYSSNRWEKIFQPVRFREKIKFNFSIILWLESSDESTVMLKKFYWSLLYSPNRGEKIFFLSKFFDQSDFEKKSNWIIRLFCHWNRGMSRQWWWKNSIDLCCILKSGRKYFYFFKIFQPIRFREKMELSYSIILSLESRDESTVMLKIFDLPLWYSPNPGEKICFNMKIFQAIRFREKNELNFSIILWLESSDESTVMLKKFYWSLLYSPNRGEKIFFLSKFFDQSDFEKKSNWIIRLFCHWNRGMSRQWWWKNSIDLCCILKSGRKYFYFFKIFQPIRFREKMELSYSIILSLESRDESTVMLKIFDLPLWYSPNPGEKICFNMKIFQAIRFREKNELNFSIILWLESRDEWTVMQKKFYLPLLYFPNRGEKFFFLWKFLNQWDFEKKSNPIFRLFCDWNRVMSRQRCWKNSIDLYCILQIG